jgi:hypothetical protein
MARGDGYEGEPVRQHVRKVLEQLTARQREKRMRDEPPSPPALGDIEVEREDKRPAGIRDDEGPT